jgi:hypothetical protein
MTKRPKQLRMDGEHVLLLTVLRSYMGAAYDSDVGAAAIRCLAEQVAVNIASRGNVRDLAALIPILNDAARASNTIPDECPDPYRYEPGSRVILRWAAGTYHPVPQAFTVA